MGEQLTKAGERLVLVKDHGVMVVGLSDKEYNLLQERESNAGRNDDRLEMIPNVDAAVMDGLCQSEESPETQIEFKLNWCLWALHLCDGKYALNQQDVWLAHVIRVPKVLVRACDSRFRSVSPQRRMSACNCALNATSGARCYCTNSSSI